MVNLLQDIVAQIDNLNPIHGKKIRKNLQAMTMHISREQIYFLKNMKNSLIA